MLLILRMLRRKFLFLVKILLEVYGFGRTYYLESTDFQFHVFEFIVKFVVSDFVLIMKIILKRIVIYSV